MAESIGKVSKAIAGMLASIVSLWLVTLFGFEVPAETIEWATGIIATVVAGVLGFVVTFLSPKNRE